MERLDPKALKKISGPSWKALRPKYEQIHEALIAVSPQAHGQLTTIYVKYDAGNETGGQPYAVVWVKRSAELTVGLSLPENNDSPELGSAPARYAYAGLTRYLQITPDTDLPEQFSEWAKAAYMTARSRAEGCE